MDDIIFAVHESDIEKWDELGDRCNIYLRLSTATEETNNHPLGHGFIWTDRMRLKFNFTGCHSWTSGSSNLLNRKCTIQLTTMNNTFVIDVVNQISRICRFKKAYAPGGHKKKHDGNFEYHKRCNDIDTNHIELKVKCIGMVDRISDLECKQQQKAIEKLKKENKFVGYCHLWGD